VSDEHDAFGRPRRPESTDPFGEPVDPERPEGSQPAAQAASSWAPPAAPPGDETVASWAPPVSPAAPEGVPSGWWRRVGAAVIDGLVIGVGGAVVGAIIASAADASGDASTAIGAAIGLVLGTIYYGALMSRSGANNGQTLGKQATGIRVVRLEGGEVTFGYAFVREILVKTIVFGYLAFVTLYIATIVNYLWPLWDPRNQALHDKIVKSQVRRTGP
jgi:uncharacterized RDD family membrane protein YckC